MAGPTSSDEPEPARLRSREWDNSFLADRMANWFPDRTVDQIRSALALLPDAEFWRLYAEVFKANTTVNIVCGTRECAKRGWFIEGEFPGASVGRIAEMYVDGKEDEANSILESYYDSRRPAIESELVAEFPRRAALIQRCFALHDQAAYDASIPLSLIQADGISHDLYGAELFRVKKNASALKPKLETKTIDWLWDALSEVLRDPLPMALHESRTSRKFNRHLILHGASLDYGTKANSLRAISLLAYLGGMSRHERESHSKTAGGAKLP